MPRKKLTHGEKREERHRLLGLIIVEVARAFNDGTPRSVNQTDVIGLIKKRHGGRKLSGSTMSGYINEWLRTDAMGRVWLETDARHGLALQSEETVLKDSKSIKALMIARRMANSDDRFSIKLWSARCKRVNGDSPEACREYLNQYEECRYIVNGGATGETAQLDVAAINQDMFYLRQAQNADLKSRPKRRQATP
jgi:hypothetical protein